MAAKTMAPIKDNDDNGGCDGSNHYMIILYYCYPPIPLTAVHNNSSDANNDGNNKDHGDKSSTKSPAECSAKSLSLLTNHQTFQTQLCNELNLFGRIRVSEEGINGVLSGKVDELKKYEARLRQELKGILSTPPDDEERQQRQKQDNTEQCRERQDEISTKYLDVKYCHLRQDVPIEKQLFDSLSVKVTNEVVSLFENKDNNPGHDRNKHALSKGKGRKGGYGRGRRRNRRRQRRSTAAAAAANSSSQNINVTNKDFNFKNIAADQQKHHSGSTTSSCPISTQQCDCECREQSNQSIPQLVSEEDSETSNDVKINDIVEPIQDIHDFHAGDENDLFKINNWGDFTPAMHLSPQEWNQRLLDLSSNSKSAPSTKKQPVTEFDASQTTSEDSPLQKMNSNAILLDTRNIYETRVGHFAVPNLPTFFPNTRKFSSLPQSLHSPEAIEALNGKDVYMYCTGGVRCERAGTYLRALSQSGVGGWKGKEGVKGVYQLRGGIQKYLEDFGTPLDAEKDETNGNEEALVNLENDYKFDNAKNGVNCPSPTKATLHSNEKQSSSSLKCLYRGKNFVFDPRRTDPIIGNGITHEITPESTPIESSQRHDTLAKNQHTQQRISNVGKCIICSSPHDDYDNGHAPSEGKEARCCRCRVLVLVCNPCRRGVRCWGESDDGDQQGMKMELHCGRGGTKCVDEGNVAEDVEIALF